MSLTRARQKSRAANGIRVAAVWILAFGLGVGVGRWMSAPADAEPARHRATTPAPSTLPGSVQTQGTASSAPETQEGSNRRPPLESDEKMAEAGSLADYPGDTAEVLGAAIDTLRDDEIIAALSTITDAHPEDLRDIRDPRALAQRMSAIAMEDLIRAPSERPGGLARVYFSEEELKGDPDRENAGTGREFGGKVPILATFSNADYREDRVFLKWSRLDDPGIVLFRPYPVDRGPRYSAVWLEPRKELPPGRYRVAFYSSDEALDPVASGLYSVVASPNN